MALLKKRASKHFSLSIDMFQDLRIRKLIHRKGGQASAIYTLLLCMIYRNGYFIEVDEDMIFLVSEQLGFEEEYTRGVIECCVELGLFDKNIFTTHKVLTSEDIQLRYRASVKKPKRNSAITDYSLVMPVQDTQKAAEDKKAELQSPPQPAPMKLETAIEKMWNDRQWVKAMCMIHSLTDAELSQKLDRFIVYLRANGNADSTFHNIDKAQTSFNSWLRKNASVRA